MAFPAQEASVIPFGWGRRPQRGLESSDYLIAADTKPLFLPLSIVTDIFIQDPDTVSTRASVLILLKASQKSNSTLPIGCVQVMGRARCLCFPSPRLSK